MIRNFDELLNTGSFREPVTLVLAGAEEPKMLKAVGKAADKGYIRPILVGEPEKIRGYLEPILKEHSFEPQIVSANGEAEICEKACTAALSTDKTVLMKGLVNTSSLLRSILHRKQEFGVTGLISHISLLELPYYDRVLGLSDTSINIRPNLEEKAQILKSGIDFFHCLGYECPKGAVLASVETVNPKMPDTVDAAALKEISETGEFGNCLVEGPISLDLAIDPAAAAVKKYQGKVRGDADFLLVPDITAGNLLGKSFNLTPGSRFAGFILGTRIPIGLTSRASSPENKFYTMAIGALLAEGGEPWKKNTGF
ncbi:phosphate acyltransferase [Hominifimenecus sp. rT4P-3]|uniref:phosphate acyltransferase n=1 Tax=Hominifimenecus sp. rT4P-3 TaxID=3242979 RepID=UPI003DA65048